MNGVYHGPHRVVFPRALRPKGDGMDANGTTNGTTNGTVMDGKKRARLVERDRNHFHRGQYEIWDVGDECGVYVDFNPCPYGMGNPETMAFPVDLRKYSVTSWQELGYWPYDATGGKAISELGYEPIEEEGSDDSAD